jgi:hypothetical protein
MEEVTTARLLTVFLRQMGYFRVLLLLIGYFRVLLLLLLLLFGL